MDLEFLRKAQEEDAVISRLIHFKENGRPSQDEICLENALVCVAMHDWNKLKIEHDGILYRKTNEREQLELPRKYHRLVLKHLHEELGHVGANRVIELAGKGSIGHIWHEISSIMLLKCVNVLKAESQFFMNVHRHRVLK